MDTVTGIPALDKIMAVVGAVYVLLTLLVPILPPDSKMAKILGRIVGDLKNVVGRSAPCAVCEARRVMGPPPPPANGPPDPPASFPKPPSSLTGLSVLLFAIVASGSLHGCPAVAPVIPVVVDVSQAVCTELGKDLQNEPDWVKFTCSVINALGEKQSTVVVMVPKGNAEAFKAQHSLEAVRGKK